MPLSARLIKRLIDIVLTVVLMPMAILIICIFAVIIKLEDSGPCFYRRRVVGNHGNFDAFKLRTMRVDAELVLQNDPLLHMEYKQDFKLRKDPRVTKIGSFLRRSSLDELPQLFNVFCGQMSLVGPRMITGAELEKYGKYRDLLLTRRPGITGYWQVNGRQDVSYHERVKMDIFYIMNWSLWLDIKILLRTLVVVFIGKGAY
jgi:lipopolysaccharide/colanic/teichoic acid biosynthesis glycosyltransferase